MTDLEIGQGSIHFHTPVDESVCTIQDAVFVKSTKSFYDCFAETLEKRYCKNFQRRKRGTDFVHGKRYSIPIIAASKSIKLVCDASLITKTKINTIYKKIRQRADHTHSSNP